jgi:hypothetical protein
MILVITAARVGGGGTCSPYATSPSGSWSAAIAKAAGVGLAQAEPKFLMLAQAIAPAGRFGSSAGDGRIGMIDARDGTDRHGGRVRPRVERS